MKIFPTSTDFEFYRIASFTQLAKDLTDPSAFKAIIGSPPVPKSAGFASGLSRNVPRCNGCQT
jgi:hypothetical protein